MYSYYESSGWTVPPDTGESSVRSKTQKHERVSYKVQSRKASRMFPQSVREPNGSSLYSAPSRESSLPRSESYQSAHFGAPPVPYHGLEGAIDLLASVNLEDHGISKFDASGMIEVLKAFLQPVWRPFKRIIPVEQTCLSKDPSVAWDGVLYPLRKSSLSIPVLRYSPHVTRLYGNERGSKNSKHYSYVDTVYDVFGYCVTAKLYDSSGSLERVWIYDRPDLRDIDLYDGRDGLRNELRKFNHQMRDSMAGLTETRKRKRPFQYFEHENTGSDQRPIQNAQPIYTPPKTKEFSRLFDRDIEFWGRRKLAAWKKSRGRQKEWRRCGFLKATTGGVRGAEAFRSKSGMENHRKLSHDMPINVLRQKPDFKRRLSRRKPNVSDSRDPRLLRYFIESALRDSGHGEANEGVDDSLEDLTPEPCRWHDHVQITSIQARGWSSRIVLPYENFIGAILGSSFRLLGFLRSENHGGVYAAENLFLTSNRYEVKTYIFHGISKKLREYRIRNLKKISTKPSFVCTVNQFGSKFAITRLEDQLERSSSGAPPASKKRSIGRRIFIMDLEEGQPSSSKISSKLSSTSRGSILGPIGRRNTREFEEAFPELPKPIPIRAGADCLLAAVESQQIVRGEPRAVISELPVPVIQEYAATLLNSASTLQNSPSVLQKIIPNDKDKTKKGKKSKTTQQIECNRTRQRESRMRKRAQKRASSAVEKSALNESDEPSRPPRLVPKKP